jgi:SAM-dependent methyltransferase
MSLPGKLALKARRFLQKRKDLKAFRAEFEQFATASDGRFELSWNEIRPYLEDKTTFTGFDAHYVYHPAWAARVVKKINPAVHIDISSTLHFCTQLSAFIPVRFYDYRPALLNLDNLISEKADLTSLFFDTNSIESLSCMHTVEHIGLGRYGDPIDPSGDLKAMNELKRVVKPGGSLLFVTPVGKARIMFNAHRIYNARAIEKIFSGFRLEDFSLVKDDSTFLQGVDPSEADSQNYGCGCFWFKKLNDHV